MRSCTGTWAAPSSPHVMHGIMYTWMQCEMMMHPEDVTHVDELHSAQVVSKRMRKKRIHRHKAELQQCYSPGIPGALDALGTVL